MDPIHTKTPEELALYAPGRPDEAQRFGSSFEGPLIFPLNVAACVDAGFESAAIEDFERRYKTFGSRIR